MTEDEKYQWLNKIAEKLIDFDDQIKELLKELPHSDRRELATYFRREAQPGNSHNFSIPIYDYIADKIESDIGADLVFQRAIAYMEATGETFYCLHCDGACTPEHIKEFEEDDEPIKH